MSEPASVPTHKVYNAIHNVMADMAKIGVGKNQTNQSQNFRYRGVDDVMDALAPVLTKHSLLILPSVLEHTVIPRETRNGGHVLHATLKLTYEFICPLDGSVKVVGPIYGEAMDTGDKATNKAMAIAYKYLCVQTFCIPVTGDDPDANTHEVAQAQGGTRGEHPEPQHESRSPAASASRPSAPARASHDIDRTSDGKPAYMRPGGIFGYGKKFYETPWTVMHTRDLEWFLNFDHTPQNTREKIIAELAWREWETSQLEAGEAAERAKREREPLDDKIP
jgi:hypothetical protein